MYEVPTTIRYKVLPAPPLFLMGAGLQALNPMMRLRKPPSQASSRETRFFVKNPKKN
jgi:hypothetical protein